MTPRSSDSDVPIWLALSELCLDYELHPEDFARLSRVLVDANVEEQALERAWCDKVAPVYAALDPKQRAPFHRNWLVTEISRRTGVSWLPGLSSRGRMYLAERNWDELRAWISLRRAGHEGIARARGSADPVERRRAVMLAAEAGAPDLAEALGDADADIQRLVLTHARQLDSNAVWPYLASPNRVVRRAAGAALGRVATPQDLPHVLTALMQGDGLVLDDLAHNLRSVDELGRTMPVELGRAPWRIADTARVVAELGAMLRSTTAAGRGGALFACTTRWADAAHAREPADPTHEPLRDRVRESAQCEHPFLRASSVVALGWWQAWTGEAALDFAVLARDPEPRVRESAALALGRTRRTDPAALDALAAALDDDDRDVRMAALRSVEALGTHALPLRLQVRRFTRSKASSEVVAAHRCLIAIAGQ